MAILQLHFQEMHDLNSLEHFNQYYSETSGLQSNASLIDFYKSVVAQRLPTSTPEVLDLGCGTRSIFEDLNISKENIIAIDFSDIAIARTPTHSLINYLVVNLATPKALGNSKFDLIFDSHCLHCIEEHSAREVAFFNIHHSLNENGIFCAEMMVQKSYKYANLPFKHVPTALDLEKEILNAGLKIVYFLISPGMVFHNDSGECDLVRVVCTK